MRGRIRRLLDYVGFTQTHETPHEHPPAGSIPLGIPEEVSQVVVPETVAPAVAEHVAREADLNVVEELQVRARVSQHDSEASNVGTAILGAGPAGLAAAYVLSRDREPATVFEADGTVGGIAKTIEFNGYRFDLGGHRFFTKLGPVRDLWRDVLGSDFITRPRLSRIYYKGKFFAYPITAKDVIGRLGIWESGLCAVSYLWASRRRGKNADTFEEWVTNLADPWHPATARHDPDRGVRVPEAWAGSDVGSIRGSSRGAGDSSAPRQSLHEDHSRQRTRPEHHGSLERRR